MADPLPIPAAFNHEAEPVAFLVRAKKKAANKFRMTSAACRQEAANLAHWLFVFHRDPEAAEVCRFLATAEFNGNFNLWSPVEEALTLLARFARTEGRFAEAAGYVKRITEAGYSPNRLDGGLLTAKSSSLVNGGYRESVRDAVAAKDKTAEREWRLRALNELCFMIELGGSNRFPVAALEKEFQENLTALRALLNVPTPAAE